MNPTAMEKMMNATGTTLQRCLGLKAVLVACAAALTLIFGALAEQARSAVTVDSFDTTVSTSQAGGHPDMTTSFTLADPGAPESARNIEFNAPEGVFGNPNSVTNCTRDDFALQSCPPNSQVGLITIRANVGGDPNHLLGTAPIFVLEPEENQTALFGLIVPELHIPIQIPVEVRTGSDYGLRFTVSEISQQTPVSEVNMVFWGFPAEAANTPSRFSKGSPGSPAGCPGLEDASCIAGGVISTLPDRPLTSNPTICTGEPLTTRLSVQSYQDPSNLSHAESSYPAVTGCEKLKFDPVLQANVTTSEADAPSGLDVILRSPQFLSRAASPSQIRRSVVTLPPGLTINPDAADGQTACEDEDANFGEDVASDCPDNSKIGTFDITTPALGGPLTGSLYLGEPKPGNQYRLFMVANGFGINAKFVASVIPDPETGQVQVVTEDLPQVAFEEFRLHLFASDRGLMATPTHCTLYPVKAQFFPWNDELAHQTSEQFFSIERGPNGRPCPGPERPFDPRLVAGTSNPIAGNFSDFHLQLDRDDGDQFIRDLNFTMPEGFTGSLTGIDYCSEGAIANAADNPGRVEQAMPSCPDSSFIGTSNVASGPGGHPFHSVGRIYLAGPLKGAPLSLAVVTPALAGPYDYGTVVVRVAIHIDPLTAQVKAVSDTVPLIIGGIPLRMRSIRVNLERENFIINPTSCRGKEILSQGIGDQGAVADFGSYFNAVDCTRLGFKPRMRFRLLGGKRATRRAVNPGLLIDLWTARQQANLRRAVVVLPNHFQIDQANLGNICSEAELAANDCEGRQPIGRAWTKTPLLDKVLTGNVYAVSGTGGLPRLAFILEGQVRIVPRADTSTAKGARLKTVVPVVPDATVGHFRFQLFGGRKGYLVNNRSLCAGKRPVVTLRYLAHNNRRHAQRARIQSPCPKRGKARRASVARATAVG